MKRSGGFGQDVSSYFNFSHHTTEKDYFTKSTVLLAKRKSIDGPKLKQNKAKQKCPPLPQNVETTSVYLSSRNNFSKFLNLLSIIIRDSC